MLLDISVIENISLSKALVDYPLIKMKIKYNFKQRKIKFSK